jgi:hypothetical protein
MVKTDTSNLVITGVLSQCNYDDILHPVASFSWTHSSVQINYEIYNKELLTIIPAFEEWRPPPEGSPHTINVISNH